MTAQEERPEEEPGTSKTHRLSIAFWNLDLGSCGKELKE